MKLIDVAVAVVIEGDHVLIAQRPKDAIHGGMWEFPGGKIEEGEKPEIAVVRELQEEIGIEAQLVTYIKQIKHIYGNWGVCLWVFQINGFNGVPKAMEQQLQLKWVHIHEVKQYPFPQANQAIIQYLCAIDADALQPAIVHE
tara:strand:- start:6 stop:431 length:426 start_codon:yes stop_codon:yes gene_type:complete